MAVNGGAGNAISFSEIQAFYGGSGEISISEYARGGDNVPSSITGASTATSSSGSATKNDFGITVANDSTSSTINHGFGTSGTTIAIDTGTAGGSTTTLTVFCSSGETGAYSVFQNGVNIGGVSEGQTSNITVNNGQNVTIQQSQGDPLGGSASYTRLTRVYDVTFANNNSTGDTYTLASSSTGHSTKSVYAAGDSQQVKNNSNSNSWTIAYDNVTGAGAGTAGDIGVSAPFYTGSAANTMSDTSEQTRASQVVGSGNNGLSMSISYTVLASDAQIEISGGGFNNVGGGETQLSSGWNASGVLNLSNQGAALVYAGPAYNNKLGFSGFLSSRGISGTIGTGTLTVTTTAGTASGSISIKTARRNGAITFTNNNSSTAYALGSSSTGGAGNVAASGTRSVNTGTTSTNPSWAVHFDTSTGNCNTNIPTTISSGNPVNLDLFNAPGTPVG